MSVPVRRGLVPVCVPVRRSLESVPVRHGLVSVPVRCGLVSVL